MSVVILCGACKGEDIPKAFRKYEPHKVFAFEPIPTNYLTIIERHGHLASLIVVPKAVWTEDCELEMRNYTRSVSHSIYNKPKMNELLKGHFKVEAMDFSKFLSEFEKGEVRMLRMDIEGAEYPVLLKCFEEGVMDRVIELQVELHSAGKIPAIRSMVSKLEHELKYWVKHCGGKVVRA